MNKGVLRRTVFLTVAAFAVFAFPPHSARAAACPATTSGFEAANPQRTVFGFRLSAEQQPEVAGDVAVDTDRGWFRIPVARMQLSPFLPGGFISGVLYARFPTSVTVRRYWFESDRAACYPPLAMWVEQDPQLRRAPPPNAHVISAEPREPYGRTDCGVPFARIRARHIVQPVFAPKHPPLRGTAEIVVDVTAGGKVLDASVWRSSGTPAFDLAALEAARKSTYAPAVAYCIAQPGRHLYRATLQ